MNSAVRAIAPIPPRRLNIYVTYSIRALPAYRLADRKNRYACWKSPRPGVLVYPHGA